MRSNTQTTIPKSLWTQHLMEDLGKALQRQDNDAEVRQMVAILLDKNLPMRYLIMKIRSTFGTSEAHRLKEICLTPAPRAKPPPRTRKKPRRDIATTLRIWFRRHF